VLLNCLTSNLFDAVLAAVSGSANQSGFGKCLNVIQIKGASKNSEFAQIMPRKGMQICQFGTRHGA